MDNNEIEINSNNSNEWLPLASDTVLSQENKYIFRLEICQLQENQKIALGFVGDKFRSKVYQSYQWDLVGKSNPQLICLDSHHNRFSLNYIKGEGFILSKENIVEMRVCLKDKTCILTDYPEYNYQVSQQELHFHQDQFQSEDVRFFLAFSEQGIRVKLREAMIVSEFN